MYADGVSRRGEGGDPADAQRARRIAAQQVPQAASTSRRDRRARDRRRRVPPGAARSAASPGSRGGTSAAAAAAGSRARTSSASRRAAIGSRRTAATRAPRRRRRRALAIPMPQPRCAAGNSSRDDHEGHRGAGHHEHPREHLHRDELRDARRERGGAARDRDADHRDQEEPAPADAVGERNEQEGRQRAEVHEAERAPEIRLGHREARGDLLERRRQRRLVEVLEETAPARSRRADAASPAASPATRPRKGGIHQGLRRFPGLAALAAPGCAAPSFTTVRNAVGRPRERASRRRRSRRAARRRRDRSGRRAPGAPARCGTNPTRRRRRARARARSSDRRSPRTGRGAMRPSCRVISTPEPPASSVFTAPTPRSRV